MKKTILYSFVLLFTSSAFAEELAFDCKSELPYSIKQPGFFGDNEQTVKEVKEIVRIVPSKEYDSNFPKAFDIGIYRFVVKGRSWEIYRYDKKQKKYELSKNNLPFRVFPDDNIIVSSQPNHVLTIRRNTAFAAEFSIQPSGNQIFIFDQSKGESLGDLSLKACMGEIKSSDKIPSRRKLQKQPYDQRPVNSGPKAASEVKRRT